MGWGRLGDEPLDALLHAKNHPVSTSGRSIEILHLFFESERREMCSVTSVFFAEEAAYASRSNGFEIILCLFFKPSVECNRNIIKIHSTHPLREASFYVMLFTHRHTPTARKLGPVLGKEL